MAIIITVLFTDFITKNTTQSQSLSIITNEFRKGRIAC